MSAPSLTDDRPSNKTYRATSMYWETLHTDPRCPMLDEVAFIQVERENYPEKDLCRVCSDGWSDPDTTDDTTPSLSLRLKQADSLDELRD